MTMTYFSCSSDVDKDLHGMENLNAAIVLLQPHSEGADQAGHQCSLNSNFVLIFIFFLESIIL